MGWKTKIQRVDRPYTPQYHVKIPKVMAEALEIEKGEEVEWKITRRGEIILKRSIKKNV